MSVSIIEGTSENELGTLLGGLSGGINFWLDGHYSGADTFQSELDTPIKAELDIIEKHWNQFDGVAVFVDDFRCFGETNLDYQDYPSKDYLVEWARKMEMSWTVEYDIFVARYQKAHK